MNEKTVFAALLITQYLFVPIVAGIENILFLISSVFAVVTELPISKQAGTPVARVWFVAKLIVL